MALFTASSRGKTAFLSRLITCASCQGFQKGWVLFPVQYSPLSNSKSIQLWTWWTTTVHLVTGKHPAALRHKAQFNSMKEKKLSSDSLSPPNNEDMTAETAACSSESEDVERKMCTVYFSQKPVSELSSVSRNVVRKCKTIIPPALGASWRWAVCTEQSSTGVEGFLCHSNPVTNVIAWTALNCLALSDPGATSAGSRCAWGCSLTWFCSAELSKTERKEWGAAADTHLSPWNPADGF